MHATCTDWLRASALLDTATLDSFQSTQVSFKRRTRIGMAVAWADRIFNLVTGRCMAFNAMDGQSKNQFCEDV
jgi:hypothetical protein